VLFVERFPPCVKRFMLRVNGSRMRFQCEQMRSQLFQVLLMLDCAELLAMELVELLHQFGMRRFEFLLLRGELIGVRLG